jgi:hypothetical protein
MPVRKRGSAVSEVDFIDVWRICNSTLALMAMIMVGGFIRHHKDRMDHVLFLMSLAFMMMILACCIASIANVFDIPYVSPVAFTVGLSWSILASGVAYIEYKEGKR